MARKTLKTFSEQIPTMDTVDLRCFLSNYRAALAAGANVGQIWRDQAQRVSVELIRRGAYDR